MVGSKKHEYLSYLVDMDVSEVLPGVISLEYLKQNNQKIPLGSASKMRPILEKTELYQCLMPLLTEMMFNAKPDPEVFFTKQLLTK
jgi:beta-phosphoglucomutase